jgi:7-keto-8-aminopelargonate synthetase-like enzyme
MPPASVASVSAAIDIMLNEPERMKHLWNLTKYAQQAFISANIDTGKSKTPIIPLYVRDDMKVLKLARILLDEGIFVNPVVSPAVSKEDALIRFSLMATHSYEQLDEAIEKINRAFKELNVAPCFQSIE